jgi:hypothetical protein
VLPLPVGYSRAMIEQETTWGMIVEGDQIYSEVTKKWYPVTGSVSIRGTTLIKVFVNGRQAGPPKEAADKVRVRRGPTGQAVDVIHLVFSGQTMPDIREIP